MVAMLMIVIMMMLMIVAVASITVFMMVMLVIMMLMAVLMVVMVMLVIMMIMSAGALVLIHMEVHAGVLHGMHHRMLQLPGVHIDHGGHEVEIGLLGWFQTVMVLHTDLQVREVQGYPFAVDGNGHLDVSHQIAGLALDPLADLHHHSIQSRFSIGVETMYVSGESHTDASDHFS